MMNNNTTDQHQAPLSTPTTGAEQTIGGPNNQHQTPQVSKQIAFYFSLLKIIPVMCNTIAN